LVAGLVKGARNGRGLESVRHYPSRALENRPFAAVCNSIKRRPHPSYFYAGIFSVHTLKSVVPHMVSKLNPARNLRVGDYDRNSAVAVATAKRAQSSRGERV